MGEVHLFILARLSQKREITNTGRNLLRHVQPQFLMHVYIVFVHDDTDVDVDK